MQQRRVIVAVAVRNIYI